LVNSTKHR